MKSEGDKKKWRLVVDFKQLNKKIINDKFPLTRIEDVLDKLGRAKYFSTLDMTSSFHQIELKNSLFFRKKKILLVHRKLQIENFI